MTPLRGGSRSSHRGPCHPPPHTQRNSPSATVVTLPSSSVQAARSLDDSMQAPPCSHGLRPHSSRSTHPEPSTRILPYGQRHSASPAPPRRSQIAPAPQAASSRSASVHSSTASSHRAPLQPGWQSHANAPTPLKHTPPCAHGAEAHGSGRSQPAPATATAARCWTPTAHSRAFMALSSAVISSVARLVVGGPPPASANACREKLVDRMQTVGGLVRQLEYASNAEGASTLRDLASSVERLTARLQACQSD